MDNIGLLLEYEDILLGKRKDFSSSYIGKNAPQKNIIKVLKYAFENLLHWTPDMVRDYTNPELIEKLHLTRLVKKLHLPPEIDRETDLFYLAHILYPDTIHFSKRKLILQIYRKVLDGELQKFPKNFFLTADGELNANICLQYALNEEFPRYVLKNNIKTPPHNIQGLYMFFSNKGKAMDFLKSVRLHVPCNSIYDYPIDMLHCSLPASQRDELMYQFGRFYTGYEDAKKKWRKKT